MPAGHFILLFISQSINRFQIRRFGCGEYSEEYPYENDGSKRKKNGIDADNGG